MNSREAYWKAKNRGWSLKLERIACKKPIWAYWFAVDIKEANIEKCQEAACKKAFWAYYFALNIPGSDIKRCQEAACKDAKWAYYFALDVKGANIKRISELCPEISDRLGEFVMERALK